MRDIEDDQPNAGIDVCTDAPAAGGANLLVFSPVSRGPGQACGVAHASMASARRIITTARSLYELVRTLSMNHSQRHPRPGSILFSYFFRFWLLLQTTRP